MLQKISAEEFETMSGVAISDKLDQEFIRENVLPRLVPVGAVRENSAWTPWNDLAVEYAVRIGGNGDDASYTMILSWDLLNHLELDLDEVHDAAVRNVSQVARIASLGDIMASLTGCDLAPDAVETPPVLVVTTTDTAYGAAAILAQSVRTDLKARLAGSFLLIPSSRHELLAMRADKMNPSDVLRLNTEVNESDVIMGDDYLATNVYACNGGDVTALY